MREIFKALTGNGGGTWPAVLAGQTGPKPNVGLIHLEAPAGTGAARG